MVGICSSILLDDDGCALFDDCAAVVVDSIHYLMMKKMLRM